MESEVPPRSKRRSGAPQAPSAAAQLPPFEAAASLEGAERYRRQIGQELHDGLGQQLTALALLAQAIERKLSERGSDVAGDVANLQRMIDECIDETRAIARGLQPAGADERSLADSLDALCARASALHGIDCRHRDGTRGQPIRAEVAGHLYRVAQEAIGNAVRHGRARNVEVQTEFDPGRRLVLRVRNDGTAPDAAALAAGSGLGVPGMRRRAAAIGAEIHFETGIDRGVDSALTVTVKVPPATYRPASEPAA